MALADAQIGGRIVQATGPVNITIKASNSVRLGDIVGYSSGWVRALATVGGVIQGLLVAGEDGDAGETIVAYQAALVDGRYTGGTVGARAYVAEGTDAGKITETAPTTQNDANTVIGTCLAADTYYLHPGIVPARSLAP